MTTFRKNKRSMKFLKLFFIFEWILSGLFLCASIYFFIIYSRKYYMSFPTSWGFPRCIPYHSVDVGIFAFLLLGLAIATLFLLAVPSRETKRGVKRLIKMNILSFALILIMEYQNYIVWHQLATYDILLIVTPLIPAILLQYWLNHNRTIESDCL